MLEPAHFDVPGQACAHGLAHGVGGVAKGLPGAHSIDIHIAPARIINNPARDGWFCAGKVGAKLHHARHQTGNYVISKIKLLQQCLNIKKALRRMNLTFCNLKMGGPRQANGAARGRQSLPRTGANAVQPPRHSN